MFSATGLNVSATGPNVLGGSFFTQRVLEAGPNVLDAARMFSNRGPNVLGPNLLECSLNAGRSSC